METLEYENAVDMVEAALSAEGKTTAKYMLFSFGKVSDRIAQLQATWGKCHSQKKRSSGNGGGLRENTRYSGSFHAIRGSQQRAFRWGQSRVQGEDAQDRIYRRVRNSARRQGY
ncbi:MAG: hypothetical protein LBR38_09250 [Synergistaceae bacterium]|nr:hypothetical protein [Synergistaceae bacterium]